MENFTIESNEYEFGKNLYYFPNQIVVWRGATPGIFIIKEKAVKSLNRDCYVTKTESHNSLHYSNLRPATKEEIKLLGKKRQIFFNN